VDSATTSSFENRYGRSPQYAEYKATVGSWVLTQHAIKENNSKIAA